jgi:hypothetical protein
LRADDVAIDLGGWVAFAATGMAAAFDASAFLELLPAFVLARVSTAASKRESR